MAGVLLREAFAFEDMAEMAAAISADYLRATPVHVQMALNAPRVFFIEARPAAARLEFSLRRIKRVVATPANEGAGRKLRLVLPVNGRSVPLSTMTRSSSGDN